MSAENWYDRLCNEPDDALERAQRILESLRGALPCARAGAVDEAQALLQRAARLYQQVQKAQSAAPAAGKAETRREDSAP